MNALPLRLRLICALGALLLSATLARAAVLPVAATFAPRAGGPTIDGKLTEEAWSQTPVLTPYISVLDETYPTAQTEAMVFTDGKVLYFGFRLYEPNMNQVVAKRTARDSGVWADDCVEIFLKPGGAKDYYQFVVNSLGTQEDVRGHDNSWNASWQAKAGTFPGGWTVEVGIPYSAIGLTPATQEGLTFNVCRERPAAREYSAWAAPGSGFHNVERFGELRLVDRAPLLYQFHAPGEIRGVTGTVELEASGPTASYRAIVTTFSAGAQVAVKAQALRIIAGERHTIQLPFTVPGTSYPLVQVAVEDLQGRLLFRSTTLPLQVPDAGAYQLGRVERLLAEIKATPPSRRFSGRMARWTSRLERLRRRPDAADLDALAQEIAVAALAARVPASYREAPVFPFPLPPFRVATETFLPAPAAVGQPVTITACRGEYEPGTLFLLAVEDLPDTTIEITPLRRGRTTLPASAFDLYILKNWYQAGTDSTVAPTPVFVPELLLKDASILTANHRTQRNDFRFDPQVGPEVGTTLQPVDIPAYENRQFWLLLHVPEDQPAGLYRGEIQVRSRGRLVAEAPLQVTVLPLALEKADVVFSMMAHNTYTNGKDPRADQFYKAVLAMCVRYGLDSLYVQEGGSITPDGRGWKIDMPLTRAALELRRQYGLTGPTAYNGLHWNVPQLNAIWTQTSAQLAQRDNPLARAFVAYCQELKRVAAQAGLPDIYVYSHDEPGYDATGEHLKQARLINDLIHQGGLPATEAITSAAARILGGNLDLPVLSGEAMFLGEREAPEGIPHAWWYYHPLENPTHDRLATGLVTWYMDLDGVAPYALAALGGWDDWKGYGNYRPERYIYDGRNAPIPTVQFEAYREGVDDYKYLNMIQRRVDLLRKTRLTAEERQVVRDARDLLDEAPQPFAGRLSQVERQVTGEDWAALRARMQDLLLKLSALTGR